MGEEVSAARLERIAAVTKQSEAQVVKLVSKHGIETYRWLCAEAIERWRRDPELAWKVLDAREPGHALGCDDHDACVRERTVRRAEADAARLPAARSPLDEPEVF